MNSLAEINAMPTEGFVTIFGEVAEHSPWVARRAAAKRPFASREAMVQAFVGSLETAPRQQQLALIRAHPDLATRAKLTDDSTREQSNAGLDTLTPEELARITRFNNLYKSKFDFPFIFAVKDATKQQILKNFAERLNNSAEDEFAMAISQVNRILRFRIEDRVSP